MNRRLLNPLERESRRLRSSETFRLVHTPGGNLRVVRTLTSRVVSKEARELGHAQPERPESMIFCSKPL